MDRWPGVEAFVGEAAAAGKLTEGQLAKWVRRHIGPRAHRGARRRWRSKNAAARRTKSYRDASV